jgi:hypothetical protein
MKNYSGPYEVGKIPTFENGKEVWKFNRHNDGAMIIMGKDKEGDDCPVLNIPMRVNAKRGEAWRTTDPDQEAFAAALVELMNKWEDCL